VKHFETIVVLAGDYEERIPAAISAYHKGYSKQFLLTNGGVRRGWSHEHQRNLYEIERSEILLIKHGIPQQAIIKLPFVKSGTVYDALMVKEYVEKHNIRSILLVTSDSHARRAFWIFNRVLKDYKIEIGVFPAKSRNDFLDLGKEIIKSVYYVIKYGLFGMVPELKL
jgi:uncharacterized SAM-binding protein YcdF (DUF218 family)